MKNKQKQQNIFQRFFNLLKIIIKHCATGIDGETYDVIRILFIISVIVGIGLEIYSVISKAKFDIQAYGLGIGSLLVTCGAGIGFKAKTEPRSEPKENVDNDKP